MEFIRLRKVCFGLMALLVLSHGAASRAGGRAGGGVFRAGGSHVRAAGAASQPVSCLGDSWSPLSAPPQAMNQLGYQAVWTGSRLIVWSGTVGPLGGYPLSLAGLSYDPLTDSWAGTSNEHVPDSGPGGLAVWTGTEMLFWGGGNSQGNLVSSGGRYDPQNDIWRPMNVTGAPSPRAGATAVWTGSRMVIWGGFDVNGTQITALNTGASYDPSTDSWSPTSLVGAPPERGWHVAVWTGQSMGIWGGTAPYFGPILEGGSYDPAADSWIPIQNSPIPAAESAVAVWTGSRMLVWGGEGLYS